MAGFLTFVHRALKIESPSDLGHCTSIWPSLTPRCGGADRSRDQRNGSLRWRDVEGGDESRGGEGAVVNPLEERGEASSKGTKVKWRHAILMERGEQSEAGGGEEDTVQPGV